MFKNLDNKEKAYATLIVFLVICVLFWYISDNFALWSSTSNLWLVLLVNILVNPAYAILIYWLYTQYDWRGIISGLLISIAIDIISIPHSISKLGLLPQSNDSLPLYGYSDTTFYKLIYHHISGQTGAFILYVVIPIILFYFALRVIRRTSSFNRILKQAI